MDDFSRITRRTCHRRASSGLALVAGCESVSRSVSKPALVACVGVLVLLAA
jgi:hypothetical protein